MKSYRKIKTILDRKMIEDFLFQVNNDQEVITIKSQHRISVCSLSATKRISIS